MCFLINDYVQHRRQKKNSSLTVAIDLKIKSFPFASVLIHQTMAHNIFNYHIYDNICTELLSHKQNIAITLCSNPEHLRNIHTFFVMVKIQRVCIHNFLLNKQIEVFVRWLTTKEI